MKRLILGLLIASSLGAQTVNLPSAKIEVSTFGDQQESMAAVTLHGPLDADSVIITVFYWVRIAGISDRLVMTKTNVVPVILEVAMASDPIHAPKDQIKQVDVRLMKEVERQSFEFNKETK